MYVPFEEISDEARVWVYLADRQIMNEDLSTISIRLKSFTDNWQAHGKDLKASFAIIYDQFLIIAADNNHNAASGCSIDASVHFLQQMEKEFNLKLFLRNQVPFLFNQTLKVYPLNEIWHEFRKGTINAETLTFNPIIHQKIDLKNGWIQPAGSSWLQRYLKQETS